ncbi:MAG TPA: 3-hydroxyacyl-CoA dehydrogenase [Symbiobacteriaceae bacterium]|nr:3-hydroxyacyl-CoA dehydrogenase [Symbiobacteriaceae bacterium]
MLKRIGVVGAGTMGAGIAQVAAQAGLAVLLYDIGPGPLEAGLGRIRSSLDRYVQRSKMAPAERDEVLGRIATTSSLSDFGDVDFVVEAAPEVLDLKKTIFSELDRVCRPDVVLATNTSSLSVTEVGALTGRQDRVVGMHFFNPVPLMNLVEVVRGARTGAEAAAATTALALKLGKTPVQAKDTPGFIVNRIARPFPGEALRLLGENVASQQQIDRVARLGAGFRMGPFELMDLVGMDINFAVNRSVFEQFFYEPRFRPHPLQAQMVKANLLGRKTGAGWYRYEGDQAMDGAPGAQFYSNPGPRVEGVETVCVTGDDALAGLVQAAGYTLTDDPGLADIVVGGTSGRPHKRTALILVEASRTEVTEQAACFEHPAQVVGYGGVPSVADRQLVEIAVGLATAEPAWQRAAAFFHSLGRDTEVIHDGPGLIAPRIIACLANEACFALMEGVASAADIDTAMRLGVNYPHGPLEWADQLGPSSVLAILEGLQAHTGEDRYRPCPLLRKLALAGKRFADLGH